MSDYSTNLRIELITTGTQAGTWGTTTNTNLGTILEDSIAGYVSVPVSAANQALSVSYGAVDQSRNAMLRLYTSGIATNFAVYVPPVSKQYIVWNDSLYTATIYNSDSEGSTTPAGVGVTLSAGKKMVVFSDGADFYSIDAGITSVNASGGTTGLTFTGGPITESGTLTLGGTLALANGGTGATTASAARTALGATTVGSNLFTLPNPSAVRYIQLNADNTVTVMDAATFLAAIGGGTGGGTVTSVAVSGTNITVSGSPITTNGTISISIPQSVATNATPQFSSLGLGTSAGGAGSLVATGNITAYYSDARLKTKVGDIINALEAVKQIETMRYHANEKAVELGYDASLIEVGVTAQSVQAVLPEAVAPAPVSAEYLTVHYERLVPLLIEAIKELSDKVKALENK